MIKRLFRPLSSRKVRVALATLVVAYAAEFGFRLGSDMILTVLGVGVALILGIAHEDAGRNVGASRKERLGERQTTARS